MEKIRSFEFWAFTPDPSAQNSKRKKKFKNLNLLNIKGQITRNRQKIMNNIHSLLSIFKIFLKQFRLLSEKRKGIHQLTTSIRLRLLSKILHPNFSSATLQKNFGYS